MLRSGERATPKANAVASARSFPSGGIDARHRKDPRAFKPEKISKCLMYRLRRNRPAMSARHARWVWTMVARARARGYLSLSAHSRRGTRSNARAHVQERLLFSNLNRLRNGVSRAATVSSALLDRSSKLPYYNIIRRFRSPSLRQREREREARYICNRFRVIKLVKRACKLACGA